MNKSTKIKATVIGLVGFGTLAVVGGCSDTGKFAQGLTDAPANKTVDYSEAKIIAMPDGFSNVATKCDEYGNRIYVVFKSGSAFAALEVIENDDSCTEEK